MSVQQEHCGDVMEEKDISTKWTSYGRLAPAVGLKQLSKLTVRIPLQMYRRNAPRFQISGVPTGAPRRI